MNDRAWLHHTLASMEIEIDWAMNEMDWEAHLSREE